MTAPGSYYACPIKYPRRGRLNRGCLPGRLVAYLASFGVGVEKTTTVLCEDNDIDDRRLAQAMRLPLRNGVVKKRLVGRVNFWSLPSGVEKEQL